MWKTSSTYVMPRRSDPLHLLYEMLGVVSDDWPDLSSSEHWMHIFFVHHSIIIAKVLTPAVVFLQAPRGTDLRQRALRMPRGHLWPGNEGEGCPGFRECFSYCYVWVPSLHFIYILNSRKDLSVVSCDRQTGHWCGRKETVQSQQVG